MGEMISLMAPFLLLAFVFYFFLIRPQQKRQKQVNQMQSELKKGDQIVTIGGMHGTVHSLDEGTLVIEVDGGQKLTYDRSAVKQVVAQE
ncbi:preprotein translocase subunit YajC [Amphibacillus cookii]|uniref:preprotein translocase subunit YajC n=1 Tax=Amphibacillus cookii TaxID=767787 RepID=UPI00195ABD99|nr:preprotein translocase subunit YajC [Amphibacillus cookii]MBM7541753.1 preprotein translocase subunit YajC [Amphibacillus cookii]